MTDTFEAQAFTTPAAAQGWGGAAPQAAASSLSTAALARLMVQLDERIECAYRQGADGRVIARLEYERESAQVGRSILLRERWRR